MISASRFFVSDRLRKGPLVLRGSEFLFMVRVSRHQAGDKVTLFDGTGREAEPTIKHASRDAATLTVGKVITVPDGSGRCHAKRSPVSVTDRTGCGTGSDPDYSAEHRTYCNKIRYSIITASRQSGRSRLMEVESQMLWRQFVGSKLMGAGTTVAHPGGASLSEALAESIDAVTTAAPRGKSKQQTPTVVAVAGPDAGLTVEEISAVVTHV